MKIYLRIPTNTAPHSELTNWLDWYRCQEVPETNFAVHHTYSHGVAEHRNIIVRGTTRKPGFLQSDCTHLWMIDSDTIPPRNPKALCAFLKAADEHSVVCGPYPGYRAETGIFWQVFRHNGKDGMGHDRWLAMDMDKMLLADDLFHADASGTGCMILQRKLLETCKPNPFYLTLRWDGEVGTEDMNFCRDVGGVMICKKFVCDHIKEMNLLQVGFLLRETRRKQ